MYRHNNIPISGGKYSFQGGNYIYTDKGNIGTISKFADGKKLLRRKGKEFSQRGRRLLLQHLSIY